MDLKRSLPITAFLILLLLAQLACVLPAVGSSTQPAQPTDAEQADANPPEGEIETPKAAEKQPKESTPTPVKAPKKTSPPAPTSVVYQGTAPAAGSGGVFGRLLWNGKPVEGVEIKLCDKIEFLKGCVGTEYPAVTDADGMYAILDVPPGKYGLTFRAINSDNWYYITSSILNAKDFEIVADKMIYIGDHHTVKTDLVILSPKEDERITVARPPLTWEPYADADYYKLTFHASRGSTLVSGLKTKETSFTLDRDLQTCTYSFKVEAFNAQEVKIAEFDGWRNFAVGGLPQNCKLVALTPAKGATVSAKEIKLTWEPHDWAVVYKIHFYLKGDSKVKILNFVETKSTEYTITQEVPAGLYQWVVYAYDDFGDFFAFSDTFELNVTGP